MCEHERKKTEVKQKLSCLALTYVCIYVHQASNKQAKQAQTTHYKQDKQLLISCPCWQPNTQTKICDAYHDIPVHHPVDPHLPL